MRFIPLITSSLILTACMCQGKNSEDPFEPFNRKVYKFNSALDNILLKPSAKAYRAVLPAPIRKSINNFYNNLDMIPTVGNDLLQVRGKWAIRDTWRFIINSSLGVGGLFDVAKTMGLPPHSNDLGLTLAQWGDKNSPYLVVPFLGPSTLRDGAGWLFQFALYSPYVYINNDPLVYGLLAVRYVDLRSQLLDTEHIMDEAFDKYTFMRDSYLQYRNNLIQNSQQDKISNEQPDEGSLYVEEQQTPANEVGNDYIAE